MNYKPLNQAIDGITSKVFPSTFGEVFSQYEEKYKRGAIGKLATAMTGHIPPSQTGFAKGSAEYKAADTAYNNARRNIERVRTGQHANFAKAGQEKLREIGQKLNPIRKDVPAGGLTVTIEFRAPADRAHAPRTRSAVVEMSSPEAFDLVNTVPQPQYADIFALWFKGGAVYGEGGDYEVGVTSVEIN